MVSAACDSIEFSKNRMISQGLRRIFELWTGIGAYSLLKMTQNYELLFSKDWFIII